MDSKKYIVLTIILLILSVFGIILIFKINNPSVPTQITEVAPIPTPKNSELAESIPTVIPTVKIASPSPTKKPTVTPTSIATPTAKLTPTLKITLTITPAPTSSPSAQLNFKSDKDGFSITYNSLRKLYQDTETSGNRYTFASSSGNFAVHVAPSGTWSWTNPDRNFSQNLIISGQNTFRYDIASQTIIDLQSSTKNYTLQCIHNGNATLKAECEIFIKSFILL